MAQCAQNSWPVATVSYEIRGFAPDGLWNSTAPYPGPATGTQSPGRACRPWPALLEADQTAVGLGRPVAEFPLRQNKPAACSCCSESSQPAFTASVMLDIVIVHLARPTQIEILYIRVAFEFSRGDRKSVV